MSPQQVSPGNQSRMRGGDLQQHPATQKLVVGAPVLVQIGSNRLASMMPSILLLCPAEENEDAGNKQGAQAPQMKCAWLFGCWPVGGLPFSLSPAPWHPLLIFASSCFCMQVSSTLYAAATAPPWHAHWPAAGECPSVIAERLPLVLDSLADMVPAALDVAST